MERDMESVRKKKLYAARHLIKCMLRHSFMPYRCCTSYVMPEHVLDIASARQAQEIWVNDRLLVLESRVLELIMRQLLVLTKAI